MTTALLGVFFGVLDALDVRGITIFCFRISMISVICLSDQPRYISCRNDLVAPSARGR